MNVGATKPSDYGLYFQWGDTQGYTKDQVGTGEGKKKFASDWSDYKWRLSGDSDDNVAFTKYTNSDDKLELEDDAAHIYMGGSWHMPTDEQIDELLDNTTNAWTELENVSGITFTSKKDTSKSIFIPNAGVALDGSVDYDNEHGILVCGSMVGIMFIHDVYGLLYFDDDHSAYSNYYIERYRGIPVRGVIGEIK